MHSYTESFLAEPFALDNARNKLPDAVRHQPKDLENTQFRRRIVEPTERLFRRYTRKRAQRRIEIFGSLLSKCLCDRIEKEGITIKEIAAEIEAVRQGGW